MYIYTYIYFYLSIYLSILLSIYTFSFFAQTLGQPPLCNFIGHPDGQACVKSGYVHGGETFVTKVRNYDYLTIILTIITIFSYTYLIMQIRMLASRVATYTGGRHS